MTREIDIGFDDMDQDVSPDGNPEARLSVFDELTSNMEKTNLAKDINDSNSLTKIADIVMRGYSIDKDSRQDWEDRNEKILGLIKFSMEPGEFPFKNSSDAKFPLLLVSAIQFSSRAYQNIVKGRDVVKAVVNGADPDGKKAERAKRIGQHMSFQLLEQMEDWEESIDKLLVSLPIIGVMFTKSYRDFTKNTNACQLVFPQDLIVNYYAKSLKAASRITHRFSLLPHEIEARKRSGVFLDIELGTPTTSLIEDDTSSMDEDTQPPHVFLEQHTRYDLDDDGYPEPYIITVHEDTQEVVRITAAYDMDTLVLDEKKEKVVSIDALQYFTRYCFFHSIDGSFYCQGFGTLQGPINGIINTILNQIIDSGTWANTRTGLIGSGLSLLNGNSTGTISLSPNEFLRVQYTGDDIRKEIYEFEHRDVTAGLFNTLALLIDAGKEISTIADVLTGQSQTANVSPTVVLALIEQSLKVQTAIYKRIYLGLKSEFGKYFKLNRLYLEDEAYYRVNDEPGVIAKQDYNEKDCDVVPVSDPANISDTQRLMKAQALLEMLGRGLNDTAIMSRFLEALQIEGTDEIKVAPPQPPPPEILQKERELDIKERELVIKENELATKWMETQSKIIELQTKAIKNIADAEAKEAGPQIDQYKGEVEKLTKAMKAQGIVMDAIRKQADATKAVPTNSGVE